MSEQNDSFSQRDVESQVDQLACTANLEEKTKSSSSSLGYGLIILFFIISTSALGLSLYIGWRGISLEKDQSVLMEGVSQLQTQLARQQARQSDVIQNLSLFKKRLEEQEQYQHNNLVRIDSLAKQIRKIKGNTRDQWRITEVEHLLRLANQRLQTISDVTGAQGLLLSADRLLRDMDDYSLFPVRKVLSEDIGALKTITKIDLESTWLRLQRLKDLVPQLKLLNESRLAETVIEASTDAPAFNISDDKLSHLKKLLAKAWFHFSSLFRFSARSGKPVQALLTLEEDYLLRHDLLLLIDQSKLALMLGEEVIYQKSLEDGCQLLNLYFSPTDPQSLKLLSEFTALKEYRVTPVLPDIHRSLEAIKRYSNNKIHEKEQHKQEIEKAEPQSTINEAPESNNSIAETKQNVDPFLLETDLASGDPSLSNSEQEPESDSMPVPGGNVHGQFQQ